MCGTIKTFSLCKSSERIKNVAGPWLPAEKKKKTIYIYGPMVWSLNWSQHPIRNYNLCVRPLPCCERYMPFSCQFFQPLRIETREEKNLQLLLKKKRIGMKFLKIYGRLPTSKMETNTDWSTYTPKNIHINAWFLFAFGKEKCARPVPNARGGRNLLTSAIKYGHFA